MPQASEPAKASFIPKMIKDENGKVYLMYHQPVPKLVSVNGTDYVCDVRHGVSMLLVSESEADALLGVRGGCCGRQKLVFHLPSQEAVNVWQTGTR